MSAGQHELVLPLLEAHGTEHLAAPFAALVSQCMLAGLESAHLAYAGAQFVGEPAYYRLHGDHFIMEFATVDSSAQHLHTVFHLT
jgi:hypothetical protein